MKYVKVTQKILLELSLLGVWKNIMVSKLPYSAGFFFFGTLEFAGVEVLQSRKEGHISSFLLID